MASPARGNTVVFQMKEQIEQGIPAFGSDFTALRLNTPTNFNLLRSEEDDGSLDPSSFQQPMVPSTIRGEGLGLNLRLTSGHSLPLLFHLLRSVTKSTISGGFRYEFAGDALGPDFGFTVYVALNPVERYLRHTVKFESVEIDISGDSALMMNWTGQLVHGQSYDQAVETVVVGTYALQPSIRGSIRHRDLGDVHVEITNLSPLSYRAEISDIAPTFPGVIETPVFVDPVTGRGFWQNLQGAVKLEGTVSVITGTPDVTGGTGFAKRLGIGFRSAGVVVDIDGEEIAILEVLTDSTLTLAANHAAGAAVVPIHLLNRYFGYDGEVSDPVEIVFQGDDTDLGDIAVGDRWQFDETIVDRVATFTPFDRFTKSHVTHFFREVGDTVWERFDNLTSTINITWPLEIEEGTGTRYLTALDRTGRLMALLDPFDATFRTTNKKLVDWAEGHTRIEAKVEILGKQLGNGDFREGHIIQFPSSSVTSLDRPVSGPDRLNITTQVTGTTDNSGVSPVLWDVFSESDFTEATFIGV